VSAAAIPIRPLMPEWTDRQIGRFLYRTALFARRGMTPERAEAWADWLSWRDHDRDDRHLCIECKHIQRSGGCFAASQGRVPGAHRERHAFIPDVLQRCNAFEFQTP